MRYGLLGLLVVAATAHAIDITTCGQVVPFHETGTMQVDLTGCTVGVVLDDRATLEMNGHAIADSTDAAVDCLGKRCTVLGPGEIAGGSRGIRHDLPTYLHSKLLVQDLDIHDVAGIGIGSNSIGIGRGGTVRATNVAVRSSGLYFFDAAVVADKLQATDLTVTDSDTFGVTSFRIRATRLTATGNYEEGVQAEGPVGKARLVDSVLTGNSYNFQGGGDIWAFRRPSLIGTTCGRSEGPLSSDFAWCVCANDPPPYCP